MIKRKMVEGGKKCEKVEKWCKIRNMAMKMQSNCKKKSRDRWQTSRKIWQKSKNHKKC